jgi:hypothetical protein
VQVIIHVLNGGQPSVPETTECDPILWGLLQDCFQKDPSLRPAIYQITNRLIQPPIMAKAAESTTDWDETSTCKFRRRVQDRPLLPLASEIQWRIFGDGALHKFIHFTALHPRQCRN